MSSNSILISGPAGAGKAAYVNALITQAKASGRKVARVAAPRYKTYPWQSLRDFFVTWVWAHDDTALVILGGQQTEYLIGFLGLLESSDSLTKNQTWVAIQENPSDEIVALFDQHVVLS